MISNESLLAVLSYQQRHPADPTPPPSVVVVVDPELDQHQLSTTVSFALSFVTLFFALLGTITNAVSLILYTRPTMKSSMNVLLAGLSAFDMCFSLLSIPTFVVPPMCVYKPAEWSFLCNVTTYSTLFIYPLNNVAKTGGIWTLVYITVQRWLTVQRPFRRARGSSILLARRALVIIFAAATVYNAPRFFEHRGLDADENDDPTDYIKVKEYLRRYALYMSVYYSILYLLTHFVIPFTVLAFINGTMTCAIRRALKANRVLSHSERAAAMMATVVFVFVCCNTLPFVMNFVEFIDRDLWVHSETKICLWAVNDMSNILLLVGASSNAFIYYYCNRKYAQVLKRYICETYQLAKERFDYPGGGDRPVSRYRMVAGMQQANRRPIRGPYYHHHHHRHPPPPSSTPSPPPFAVYSTRPRHIVMANPHRANNTEKEQAIGNGVAPFDLMLSPKCSLIWPNQHDLASCRKRSRSVLALAWRATTGRLRSGTMMGRSLSSTALTMVEQQAALRMPQPLTAGGILQPASLENTDAGGAATRRGGGAAWKKTPAISMGSLL